MSSWKEEGKLCFYCFAFLVTAVPFPLQKSQLTNIFKSRMLKCVQTYRFLLLSLFVVRSISIRVWSYCIYDFFGFLAVFFVLYCVLIILIVSMKEAVTAMPRDTDSAVT